MTLKFIFRQRNIVFKEASHKIIVHGPEKPQPLQILLMFPLALFLCKHAHPLLSIIHYTILLCIFELYYISKF